MNNTNTNSPDPAEATESKPRPWVYRSIRVSSWDDARQLGRKLGWGWAFRGQENASWGLSTKLERVSMRYSRSSVTGALVEEEILDSFQRRAHHYITAPPPEREKWEWLALIQHYGGPTRLLDFTYSFYVAAFFAIENAEKEAAIWAINLLALAAAARPKPDEPAKPGFLPPAPFAPVHTLSYIFPNILEDETKKQLVVPLEPKRMNERLAIQQGLFIVPLDITVSFEANLAATFDASGNVFQDSPLEEYHPDDTSLDLGRVLKIILPGSIHKDAILDLVRMNITAASLFPGLDGFARSLQHLVIRYDMRELDELARRFMHDNTQST